MTRDRDRAIELAYRDWAAEILMIFGNRLDDPSKISTVENHRRGLLGIAGSFSPHVVGFLTHPSNGSPWDEEESGQCLNRIQITVKGGC